MGLFGGSSKTNTNVDTDVNVSVDPVFTVGIDTAEALTRGLDGVATNFGGGIQGAADLIGDAIGQGLASAGGSLDRSTGQLVDGVSNIALLLGVAGVGVASMFIIARK